MAHRPRQDLVSAVVLRAISKAFDTKSQMISVVCILYHINVNSSWRISAQTLIPKICISPWQRKGSFSSLLSSAESLEKLRDHQLLLYNINSSATPWNTENRWGWWCNGQNKNHYMCLIFIFIKIFWKPSHFGQMSHFNHKEAGP